MSNDPLVEGMAAARAIEWEKDRALALAALATQLTSKAREQALTESLSAVQGVEDRHRAQTLAVLALQLTGTTRKQMLAEGIAAVQMIKDENERESALAMLAPQLMGDLLAEGLAAVLAAVLAIERDRGRAKGLAAVVPQLTETLLVEGLMAARAIGSGWDRARALAALLHQFTSVAAESVRRNYQETILIALRTAEDATRTTVLYWLSDKDVFRPDALGLTPAAVARIAEAMVDVCRRWEWL